MYENEIQYTCSVTIDGTSVVDHIEAVDVSMQEDTYVNEVTIRFNSDSWLLFHTLCNPNTNWGTERITVTVNGVEFKFLLEKRNTSINNMAHTFNVWGRSKAALLDLPFSAPISDTEESTNYWQYPTLTRQASEIVNHLLSGTGISVQFLIDDFTVYSNNFSVDNETPIRIINRLAGVPGGRVRSGPDGNLIIDYKEFSDNFTADSPLVEFTDIDEIVQLDEEIIEPPGYNRVRVVGFDEGIDTADQNIILELLGETCVAKGQEFDVKVYTEPLGLEYEFDTTIGTFSHRGEYTHEVTETIFFAEGRGSADYPITSVTEAAWHGDDLGAITWEAGYRNIISATEGFGVLEITYTATYNLYTCIIFDIGGAVIFAEKESE
jgi:hypothetical protein